MRPALIYRTNRFDAHDAAELSRLREAGMPIVVAADERHGVVDTGDFAKVSLSQDSMKRLRLAPHPDAGWRCGDYVLYLAAEALPDADEFWLIERDVRINFERPSEFFALFADQRADFLAVHHALAKPNWYWRARMEPIRPTVYQTLFTTIRISRRAVGHLLPVRQSLRDLPRGECPNDESFVASVLANDGFSCEPFRNARRHFPVSCFALERVESGTALDAKPRDRVVHHAVLYGEDYYKKAVRRVLHYASKIKLEELIEGIRIELGDERAAEFASLVATGALK